MIERMARYHMTHQQNRHGLGSRQYNPISGVIDQDGLKPDNHGSDRLYSLLLEPMPQIQLEKPTTKAVKTHMHIRIHTATRCTGCKIFS
jgi:hypothetical protein